MAVIIWLGATIGCAYDQGPSVDTANLARIRVDFELTERDICENGMRSPEIRLTELTAGAVNYDVRMTDLDSPHYKHWNETIQLQQPVISAGKGINYRGPACPPNGHHYRISILATNAAQQPVAYGEKTITAKKTSRIR